MSLNVDTLFSYSSSLAGGRSYTGNHIHLPFYLKRKRGSRAMLYSTTFSHPSSVGMGLASILFPIAEAMSRMDARPIPTEEVAHRTNRLFLALPPIGIEVRAVHQLFVARSDMVHCQGAQAIDAEIGADVRANDIAMHDCALEIINRVSPIGSRFDRREIAQQPTGKSIASPGWIDHLFKRR